MRKIVPCLVILLILSMSTDVTAKAKGPYAPRDADGYFKTTFVETPNLMTCFHWYNNLLLGVTNQGFFGTAGNSSKLGECDDTGEYGGSGEFPPNSDIEYLYQGSLWIGAVVGDDTLVSVGFDGWQYVNEIYPCADASDPHCGIERRSFRRSDPYYHEDAKSDLELVTIYTDTLVSSIWTGTDFIEGRPHIPIGLEIRQHTYSWSVDYAASFILLDFQIRNITHLTAGGATTIENLFLGINSDGDVGHANTDDNHDDDLCGFLEFATDHPYKTACGIEQISQCDPIDLTYIIDNDGDPVEDEFNNRSPLGVLGTRVMRAPDQDVKKVSFNWWTGHMDGDLDWGPMKEATQRDFGTGGKGTPEGDRNKYYLLSNGEHDYDQIYANEDFPDWLPHNSQTGATLATGGDTRFLISFGPFDLPPDPDTFLQITIAYVAGHRLHVDPSNGDRYLGEDPESFYEGLNFNEVSLNSIWAAWVYDNPVLVPAEDCNFCLSEDLDSLPLHGDGIPDFQAAVPPPSPPLRYRTELGEVFLTWNGLESESFLDPFTFLKDFEGYRIYWGRQPTIDRMSRLESRDFADYKRYKYRVTGDSILWSVSEPPFTLDSLNKLYGSEGNDFNPENWTCQLNMGPGEGFLDRNVIDEEIRYCFEATDFNQSLDGWLDGARDVPIETGIRKVYATEIREGLIKPDRDTLDQAGNLIQENLDKYWLWDINPRTGDSIRYHKYWEYEYEFGNLLPSIPHYFAVTAFDFGEFKKDFGAEGVIGALEGSPLDEVVELWAINDAATVVANYPNVDNNPVAGSGVDELEVKVYPNPYIGDGRYLALEFEKTEDNERAEHARELHFVNLPEECTIKIFTLDGDMVREIKHPGRDSDWDSKVHWNLRTRNNELVSSGIYLYSVESSYGNQVGKFVVIF